VLRSETRASQRSVRLQRLKKPLSFRHPTIGRCAAQYTEHTSIRSLVACFYALLEESHSWPPEFDVVYMCDRVHQSVRYRPLHCTGRANCSFTVLAGSLELHGRTPLLGREPSLRGESLRMSPWLFAGHSIFAAVRPLRNHNLNLDVGCPPAIRLQVQENLV
jgi:hypothetical protein